MTADQPTPQPGDRVLIEAEAVMIGVTLRLAPIATDGSRPLDYSYLADRVRWRPMPAAGTGHPAGDRDFAAEAEKALVEWFHGTPEAPYAAPGHSTRPDECSHCNEAAEAVVAALGLDDLQAERDRLREERDSAQRVAVRSGLEHIEEAGKLRRERDAAVDSATKATAERDALRTEIASLANLYDPRTWTGPAGDELAACADRLRALLEGPASPPQRPQDAPQAQTRPDGHGQGSEAQEGAEAADKPWRLDFICCGREDGHKTFATYEEADAFRDGYTSGPGVDHRGYGTTEPSGHQRAAILTQTGGAKAPDLMAALQASLARARDERVKPAATPMIRRPGGQR